MHRRMLFVSMVALWTFVGCSDGRLESPHHAAPPKQVPDSGSTGVDAIQIAKHYLQEGHADRFQTNAMSLADEDRWIRIGTTTSTRSNPETFGEQQLKQLLDDRPSMKGIVHRNQFIYRWAVIQFDASTSHDQIHWDPSDPQSGRPAEHQSTYQDSPAYVRITNADSISGRDKWLMLVYELHNFKNGTSFIDLWNQAIAGKIDRNTFSIECVKLEFNAMIETQAFFRRHPLPGATEEKDPNYVRCIVGSSNFDDYIKMLESDGPHAYDPRDYFAGSFDTISKGWFETWIERMNMRND